MRASRVEDAPILEEVERTYASVPVQSGDVVLDLGAHIGAASRLLLDKGAGHVVAVEPDPANVALLRINLDGDATVIPAAVGAEAGETTLYAYPGKGHLSTIVADDVHRAPLTVPVVAFRALLAEHRPTIVKCDIEFGEYDLAELWNLPDHVRVLALELHLRYDLVFHERRETPAELLARRRHAAGLLTSLERQGFTVQRLSTKLGDVPGIDDSTGFDPLARSLDGVWVR